MAICCGDIGGLLHQACTGLGLPHRANASRHVESATVLGRTCACRSRDKMVLESVAYYCMPRTRLTFIDESHALHPNMSVTPLFLFHHPTLQLFAYIRVFWNGFCQF